MNVWAIADLHLSFARPDRRERYAARWRDHALKIEAEWRSIVRPGDLVLVPGDISMALGHRDLQPDLAWLDRLPGSKVLGPGNHDRWWNNLDAIQPMLRDSLAAVEGTAIAIGDVVVCGARGAPVPTEASSAPEQAAAAAELAALERALDQAALLGGGRDRPLYVLWHYPPFDEYHRPGPWVERMTGAHATACVYGHLHIEGQWSRAVQHAVDGVRYHCTAADAVGFRPLLIDRLGADHKPVPPPIKRSRPRSNKLTKPGD